MSHKSKKLRRRKSYDSPGLMSVATSAPMPFGPDFQRLFERREELRYRIAPDCKVHVQFDGIATQGAIRKLINHLEMSIDDFPK